MSEQTFVVWFFVALYTVPVILIVCRMAYHAGWKRGFDECARIDNLAIKTHSREGENSNGG